MILTTTLSLRGYVVGLLNANDVIDSTSIEVVHGLTTQDPYIQECYRPRPSLLIRPYKYALMRTISFGIGHLNIESRVISLLRDTDTATHCYRPLVYQVGLTRTSRRGQSLSIEAMRLALATLISNLVASHCWREGYRLSYCNTHVMKDMNRKDIHLYGC